MPWHVISCITSHAFLPAQITILLLTHRFFTILVRDAFFDGAAAAVSSSFDYRAHDMRAIAMRGSEAARKRGAPYI